MSTTPVRRSRNGKYLVSPSPATTRQKSTNAHPHSILPATTPTINPPRRPSPGDVFPPIANRGVTIHGTSPDEESCPRLLGGYDGGTELGFDGIWDERKFEFLLSELRAAKVQALSGAVKDSFFELAGQQFVMSKKKAVGGVTYSYMFEGNGATYFIHENPQEGIQPIRACYRAKGLIGRDLFFKHRETLRFLNEIGFTVEREKLSRVDLPVIVFRPTPEFIRARRERRIVCTARKYSEYGEGMEPETLTLGLDPQVCIYDKGREMDRMFVEDREKWAMMIQFVFGEEWLLERPPTTRIEFRLRRESLKSMGIDSMDDLLRHENGLARMLSHTWFRILSEPKKAGHTHEQPTSESWKEVQEALAKWYPGVQGHNEEVKRDYKRPVLMEGRVMVKQAGGCLARYIADNLGELESVRDMFERIIGELEKDKESIFVRSVELARENRIRSNRIAEFARTEFDELTEPAEVCEWDGSQGVPLDF